MLNGKKLFYIMSFLAFFNSACEQDISNKPKPLTEAEQAILDSHIEVLLKFREGHPVFSQIGIDECITLVNLNKPNEYEAFDEWQKRLVATAFAKGLVSGFTQREYQTKRALENIEKISQSNRQPRRLRTRSNKEKSQTLPVRIEEIIDLTGSDLPDNAFENFQTHVQPEPQVVTYTPSNLCHVVDDKANHEKSSGKQREKKNSSTSPEIEVELSALLGRNSTEDTLDTFENIQTNVQPAPQHVNDTNIQDEPQPGKHTPRPSNFRDKMGNKTNPSILGYPQKRQSFITKAVKFGIPITLLLLGSYLYKTKYHRNKKAGEIKAV